VRQGSLITRSKSFKNVPRLFGRGRSASWKIRGSADRGHAPACDGKIRRKNDNIVTIRAVKGNIQR